MIGEKIKEIRESKDMTQQDLAGKAGITRIIVGLIERGQTTPNMSTLQKIADALGKELKILLA